MNQQLSILMDGTIGIEKPEKRLSGGGTPVNLLNLNEYNYILLSISGGKDSVGSFLRLKRLGVDMSKVELYHQCIDGNPFEHVPFMDWPVTEAYCEAFGQHFNVPVRYMWRDGGFKGELYRRDSYMGDVYYIDHLGKINRLLTKRGNTKGRRKFPETSMNLRNRWCSGVLKIDVFSRTITNDPRFAINPDNPLKILVITGERREESTARSTYHEVIEHKTSTKKPGRIVHHWRMVIDETEQQIWDYMERDRILPHPAYLLGWGRTSCMACIFSNDDLWCMLREIAPERFNQLVEAEKELNHTIHRDYTIEQRANRGTLKRLPKHPQAEKWIEMALNRGFRKEDIVLKDWFLPAGAFSGAAGGVL